MPNSDKKAGTLRRGAAACAACVLSVASLSLSAQEIYQVRLLTQQQTVTIGGAVVPRQEVTLAAQLPGRIVQIAGQEGSVFQTGRVLVQLDETQLRAQRDEAVAAVASAQAAARNARVQYSRELANPQSRRTSGMPGMGMPGMFDQAFSRPMSSMIGMENQGIERDADLHQQGSQVSQAQSSVGQAQARVDQINAKLRDTRSIAPFDGVITRKLVEIGDTVQPGQPLIVFADTTSLQVRADIPSRLVHVLKPGQVIGARIDGNPDTVEVTVAQVFPVADEQRHTVTVKFDIAPGLPASPGTYAEVLVPDPNSGGSTPTLLVPRNALSWRGSMPGVQVLDRNDEPQLRLLRIKSGTSGDWVKVYAGLEEGERILVPAAPK